MASSPWVDLDAPQSGRLRPYKLDGRILLDAQPIIPLPETEPYQVKIRRKEDAARMTRETDAPRWDEATDMGALEEFRGPEIRRVAKEVLAWFADRSSSIWWVNRLVEIPGVEISPEGISRRPSFDMKHLVDPGNLRRCFSAFDWALQRIGDFEPQSATASEPAAGP